MLLHPVTLSTNPVPFPMGMFMLLKNTRKLLCLIFLVAGGLLLMGTTRFVLAVTQHVVLMGEVMLLLGVGGCFKIVFDTSHAPLNLSICLS